MPLGTPHISKEPYMFAKEPNISSKEPSISTKEPSFSATSRPVLPCVGGCLQVRQIYQKRSLYPQKSPMYPPKSPTYTRPMDSLSNRTHLGAINIPLQRKTPNMSQEIYISKKETYRPFLLYLAYLRAINTPLAFRARHQIHQERPV